MTWLLIHLAYTCTSKSTSFWGSTCHSHSYKPVVIAEYSSKESCEYGLRQAKSIGQKYICSEKSKP